jgi:hypothetical protein
MKGHRVGQVVMGQLEGRTGSFSLLLGLVASRVDSQFLAGLNTQQLCQGHQCFIACEIEESLGLRLPASA